MMATSANCADSRHSIGNKTHLRECGGGCFYGKM